MHIKPDLNSYLCNVYYGLQGPLTPKSLRLPCSHLASRRRTKLFIRWLPTLIKMATEQLILMSFWTWWRQRWYNCSQHFTQLSCILSCYRMIVLEWQRYKRGYTESFQPFWRRSNGQDFPQKLEASSQGAWRDDEWCVRILEFNVSLIWLSCHLFILLRLNPSSDAELLEMIERADTDTDGEISPDEFYAIMTKKTFT